MSIKFDFKKENLLGVARSVIEELKPLADKKGLYLRYEKPLKPLPKVKADS